MNPAVRIISADAALQLRVLLKGLPHREGGREVLCQVYWLERRANHDQENRDCVYEKDHACVRPCRGRLPAQNDVGIQLNVGWSNVPSPDRLALCRCWDKCRARRPMKNRALQTIASICLVIHAVGAVWTLDRTLCVASDGHVTVELAHDGACDAEARRHHGSRSDVGRECPGHSCTDVALSEPTPRPTSDSYLPVATALRVIDISLNPFALSCGKARLEDLPDAAWQAQRAREPVVLLI